jgi:hypothetical protein
VAARYNQNFPSFALVKFTSFVSHCATQISAASRSRRELSRNYVLGVVVRVNREQGPRMRRQRQRSHSHRGGGFGGAWACSESDIGDKWGRRTEGTGNTARDFARKHFQQQQQHFQQSFDFSFQFPSFGDFFNDGFADAPVADTSDRISDSSYFHKWFPQVNDRSVRSRVSLHSTRLPALMLFFVYSHCCAGPCSETHFSGGCIQSCCNPRHCSSSRLSGACCSPHLRSVSRVTVACRYTR